MADERRDAHAWLEMLASLGAARGTLHVACALAIHAIPGLTCFPSYATLTAKTGMEKSALSEHIGRLKAAKALVVTPRRGVGPKQATNVYEFAWPTNVKAARVALAGRSHKGTSAGAEADRTSAAANPTSAAADSNFRRGGRRVPPVRKGKIPEGDEEREERHSPCNSRVWTKKDCAKPCPVSAEHGLMEGRENSEDGSVFGYCRTCSHRFNPGRQRRALSPSDTEQGAIDASKRAEGRARRGYAFPGTKSPDPAPVGALTPVASEQLARSEAS